MNTDTKSKKNVSIAEAAKEMGKSEQYIRIGLQRGLFDFGFAQKMPGCEKYTYYINPVKFFAYIGKELPEKYREQKEQVQTGKYTVITNISTANEFLRSIGRR